MLPIVRVSRFLGLCFLVSVVTHVSSARALVCAGCQPVSCGFSFPTVSACEELPQNHQLILQVDCAEYIPSEAFPRLATDDGRLLAGHWEARATQFTEGPTPLIRQATQTYVFIGELPPVGQNVEVIGDVQPQCGMGTSTTSCVGGPLACVTSEEVNDCCGLYGRAGYMFQAASAGPPELVPPDGQGGAGGAGSMGSEPIVYLRYGVGHADEFAPAALAPVVSCETLEESSLLTLLVDGSLAGVTRLEFELNDGSSPPVSFPLTALPCQGTEERTFNLVGSWPSISPGTWDVVVKSFDSSGNVAIGASTTLQVPLDCTPSDSLNSVPTHTCAGPDTVQAGGCAFDEPARAEDQNYCEILTGVRVEDGQDIDLGSGDDPDGNGGSDSQRQKTSLSPRPGCACEASGASSKSALAPFLAIILMLGGAMRRKRMFANAAVSQRVLGQLL